MKRRCALLGVSSLLNSKKPGSTAEADLLHAYRRDGVQPVARSRPSRSIANSHSSS